MVYTSRYVFAGVGLGLIGWSYCSAYYVAKAYQCNKTHNDYGYELNKAIAKESVCLPFLGGGLGYGIGVLRRQSPTVQAHAAGIVFAGGLMYFAFRRGIVDAEPKHSAKSDISL